MKKFRLATWNVNECIGITCDLNNQKTVNNINQDNMMEIVNVINNNDIDIICFQEFPIKVKNNEELINLIIKNTKLKNFVYKEASPSFLFDNGRIGVAIFSKYKIESSYTTLFNNPNLIKISKTGQEYKSFDKGIVMIEINIDNTKYKIITGHAIAFAPFDKNEFDYPNSYDPIVDLINKYYNDNLIVAGDFNCAKLFDLLPSIKDKVRDEIKSPTTYSFYENRGSIQMDYILLSRTVTSANFHKIDNFSDHYVCCIDIEKR